MKRWMFPTCEIFPTTRWKNAEMRWKSAEIQWKRAELLFLKYRADDILKYGEDKKNQ